MNPRINGIGNIQPLNIVLRTQEDKARQTQFSHSNSKEAKVSGTSITGGAIYKTGCLWGWYAMQCDPICRYMMGITEKWQENLSVCCC